VESHASASAIKLLISSGADINESQEPGGTPLMSATLYQHAEGVRLLLAAGVRVNARDEKGCTALTQPSQFSAIEAGKIFIFSKRTPKVSTTFGVGEGELARQQW